jgi:hypothetical protein
MTEFLVTESQVAVTQPLATETLVIESMVTEFQLDFTAYDWPVISHFIPSRDSVSCDWAARDSVTVSYNNAIVLAVIVGFPWVINLSQRIDIFIINFLQSLPFMLDIPFILSLLAYLLFLSKRQTPDKPLA